MTNKLALDDDSSTIQKPFYTPVKSFHTSSKPIADQIASNQNTKNKINSAIFRIADGKYPLANMTIENFDGNVANNNSTQMVSHYNTFYKWIDHPNFRPGNNTL